MSRWESLTPRVAQRRCFHSFADLPAKSIPCICAPAAVLKTWTQVERARLESKRFWNRALKTHSRILFPLFLFPLWFPCSRHFLTFAESAFCHPDDNCKSTNHHVEESVCRQNYRRWLKKTQSTASNGESSPIPCPYSGCSTANQGCKYRFISQGEGSFKVQSCTCVYVYVFFSPPLSTCSRLA